MAPTSRTNTTFGGGSLRGINRAMELSADGPAALTRITIAFQMVKSRMGPLCVAQR